MLNIYVYVTHICGDIKYCVSDTKYFLGVTEYGHTKYHVGDTEYGNIKYYVNDTKGYDGDIHTKYDNDIHKTYVGNIKLLSFSCQHTNMFSSSYASTFRTKNYYEPLLLPIPAQFFCFSL